MLLFVGYFQPLKPLHTGYKRAVDLRRKNPEFYNYLVQKIAPYKLGLRAGINGMLSGDYLTTDGVDINDDKELINNYINTYFN